MGHKFFVIPDLFYKNIKELSDEDAGKLVKALIDMLQKNDVKVDESLKRLFSKFVAFYLVMAEDYEFTLRKLR